MKTPVSLSPSKVSSFKHCGLSFRYESVDKLPSLPNYSAVRGTLVHAALQGLFWHWDQGFRTLANAGQEMAVAWADRHQDPDFVNLGLDEAAEIEMLAECMALIFNYFKLEDPNRVRVAGVELQMEAEVEGVLLRGIIDRLDIDAYGALVVIDYKTGRVPAEGKEQAKLEGVFFYAMLCEELLGVRPAKVRLLYLNEPVSIELSPTDQQMRAFRQRTIEVWKAIERACDEENFLTQKSALCSWCTYQALCPEFGGSPFTAA